MQRAGKGIAREWATVPIGRLRHPHGAFVRAPGGWGSRPTIAARLSWSSWHAGQPSRCARKRGTCCVGVSGGEFEFDVAVEVLEALLAGQLGAPGPSSLPSRSAGSRGVAVARASLLRVRRRRRARRRRAVPSACGGRRGGSCRARRACAKPSGEDVDRHVGRVTATSTARWSAVSTPAIASPTAPSGSAHRHRRPVTRGDRSAAANRPPRAGPRVPACGRRCARGGSATQRGCPSA
jgi:hypothetical protein